MSDSRLGRFLAELKRRRVYRVAVVYAAVAFVIWQAADFVLPAARLPGWVPTLVLVLTLLGFPIALVLAWAYDITPAGVKRMEAESAEPVAPSEVDRVAGEVEIEARKAIAVLPFADMSPEGDQEYFSDGMSEELIDALTKVPGLRVTARTSSFQFKGEGRDVREVGRALGVTHVVEGSVRKSGGRLRITAQLVDTNDGYHLWSDRYDRDLSDIFEIQDEIAASIVRELKIRLAEPLAALERPRTENLEAYEAYLRGRLCLRELTPESWTRRAIQFLEQAIELDPTYAPAHAGLATAYDQLNQFCGPESARALARAKEEARRALDLDPTLSEAHTVLAILAMTIDRDREVARQRFERAIQANPNEARAHAWYAIYLLYFEKQFERALETVQRAAELDPLDWTPRTLPWWVLWAQGEHESYLQQALEVTRREPDFAQAHYWAGDAYLFTGRPNEAVAAYSRAVELGGPTMFYLGMLGAAHARAGNASKAKEILAELEDRSRKGAPISSWRAGIHAALGESDEALDQLERAYEEHDRWLFIVAGDARFDEVRSHPRFTGLLRKMGLEKWC
jgi:TolB-like protein/Tfp pilus assembly protein PilF